MASVQWSGIGVTNAAGSTGGTTWQRNANGAFSRNKPIPTQPNTTPQIDQRANFATVTEHWRTLSPSQMDSWIMFAETTAGEYQNRLGITCNYTGQQLFIKLNLSAFSTSFPINDPPTQPSLTANPLQGFEMLIDGGILDICKIQFVDNLTDASIEIKVFSTAGMSVGISRPRRSLFKSVSSLAGDIGGINYDFASEYVARFGLPTVGSKVFVLTTFVDIASGFELVNSQYSCIVTEL